MTMYILNNLPDNATGMMDNLDCFVEADDFCRTVLWMRNKDSGRRIWEENLHGILVTIGNLHERPVCVAFSFAKVDNHKLCFWHATSQLVDYQMIEEWFAKHFPKVRKTDANNFHNAFTR